MHIPYVRPTLDLEPGSPEAARLEAFRAASKAAADEHRHRRDMERPQRRAAVEAGPPLRDVDAAADCVCSCHPRPATSTLHDGGVTCSCQLTVEERRSLFSRLLDDPAWATVDVEETQRRDQVEVAATELGVELRHCGGFAPFQIEGVVDGRSFYLRSRHGSYRIEVAPAADPLADLMASSPAGSVIVDDGDDSNLDDLSGAFSEVTALQYATRVVQDYLARVRCQHMVVAGGRFCPMCGVDLGCADRWVEQ